MVHDAVDPMSMLDIRVVKTETERNVRHQDADPDHETNPANADVGGPDHVPKTGNALVKTVQGPRIGKGRGRVTETARVGEADHLAQNGAKIESVIVVGVRTEAGNLTSRMSRRRRLITMSTATISRSRRNRKKGSLCVLITLVTTERTNTKGN